MTTLPKGTEVDAGDIVAPQALRGTPLVIEELLGEHPHGHRYRARQDNIAVLLTIVDPALVADGVVRAALQREVKIAASVTHRSLLPVYGAASTDDGFIIVEADPGGTTVREFAKSREARGRPLDTESIYTLVAHVCNGLDALHPYLVHAYVTADTVIVAPTGRVYLSSCGVGPWLPRAPSFARFHRAGRLPQVTPEQLLVPPQLAPGTDVFGAATLFLELVTGLPLREPGQPIEELGLRGPSELVLCLERATAPSPSARPPDTATFKVELSEAVRAGAIVRGDPLTPSDDSGLRPHPSLAPPQAAAWPGYPQQPAGFSRGHPTPFPFPPFPDPPPAEARHVPDRHPTPLELELQELDRATRRISELVDGADAEELTSTVAAAVDPEAANLDEPLPPPGMTASSSLLGLRIDQYDEVASRLSTLDGEHAAEARGEAAPTKSGTYFGSIYEAVPNRPEVKEDEPDTSEAGIGDADQRPLYYLVQRGERIGPLSMYELSLRAREGRLRREDLLRHRLTSEESTAGSHDALRKSFRAGAEREQMDAFVRSGTPVGGSPLAPAEWGAPRAQPRLPTPPEPPPRNIPVVLIALGVVAVLGAIAFFALT